MPAERRQVHRHARTAEPTQRGVIYTVAPSPLDVNRIWAGTDDGLIHVTDRRRQDVERRDAAGADAVGKVSIIDAVALRRRTPRTRRSTRSASTICGRTSTARTTAARRGREIVERAAGRRAPSTPSARIRSARACCSPAREQAVYVSFDDGDHWQSLRLNMPATSIRDLVVKDDDLVVGTHGRGFWILDDITPLRQLQLDALRPTSSCSSPQTAIRVRWNIATPTRRCRPTSRPARIRRTARSSTTTCSRRRRPVTLEILDAAGKLVRRFSSDDKAIELRDEGNMPAYWIRPPQVLSATPACTASCGICTTRHRRERAELSDFRDAARNRAEPKGPWVVPGTYTVRLTASGRPI